MLLESTLLHLSSLQQGVAAICVTPDVTPRTEVGVRLDVGVARVAAQVVRAGQHEGGGRVHTRAVAA